MLIFKQCKAVWIVNSENSVNSVNHVNSVSTAYWAAYSALLHSSLMAFFACVNDEHSSLIWVSLLLSDEKFSVLKIKVLTDGGRHIFTNWANLNWDMRPPAFRIRLLSLKLLNINRFFMKHKYNTRSTQSRGLSGERDFFTKSHVWNENPCLCIIVFCETIWMMSWSGVQWVLVSKGTIIGEVIP